MKSHFSQTLKTRHIAMIALGSAIGTGLFFGSGASLKLAGPSILLAYFLGGLVMYVIVRALGEMSVYDPNVGSFSYYAYKYVGQYVGFITGFNYWFNYIIVCMLELTATTIFLNYWFPHFPHWITALILLVLFTLINLSKVKYFGEFEFWFSGIKVSVILLMIIFGGYLILSPHTAPMSNIGNLWHNGGFFAKGSSGFLASLVVVVFSFGGTELVGIAAGEAKNPKHSIPLAINAIIFRILLFYICTLAIIICLYPWNQINDQISPFVDVFSKIGIPRVANIMNIVAITAALSSLNSGIYGTARMLHNLGTQENAPQALTKINKKGIPYIATLVSCIAIAVAVVLNYLYPKHVFMILLSVATAAAIINWVLILITHIYFRKKVSLQSLSYKMPFYPISSIVAIIFFVIVIITMCNMSDMRLAIYILPLWLVILSCFYFIRQKLCNN